MLSIPKSSTRVVPSVTLRVIWLSSPRVEWIIRETSASTLSRVLISYFSFGRVVRVRMLLVGSRPGDDILSCCHSVKVAQFRDAYLIALVIHAYDHLVVCGGQYCRSVL